MESVRKMCKIFMENKEKIIYLCKLVEMQFSSAHNVTDMIHSGEVWRFRKINRLLFSPLKRVSSRRRDATLLSLNFKNSWFIIFSHFFILAARENKVTYASHRSFSFIDPFFFKVVIIPA